MIKVSFIVIAYNEARNITKSLDSILLQKDLPSYELIIVDDGSKDETVKIVTNFMKKNKHVKLYSFPVNQGRGAARDKGVRLAKGKYLAFVDADIVLPENWFETVILYTKQYDAVGGIAIPDGDSTYISQKFQLKPKILSHTCGITGSNSIYKKEIFDNIQMDSNLRGGEDVDIVIKILQSGYKIKLINNLVVKHQEDIDFSKSLKRMLSFGKGATNLLKIYKKIRIPDLSFFIYIILILSSIYFSLNHNFNFIVVLLIYPLFVSYFHLIRKFELTKITNFIIGGLANYFMITAYFIGRIIGFFSPE